MKFHHHKTMKCYVLAMLLTAAAGIHPASALVFDDGKPVPGADVKAWFTTVTIPARPTVTWRQTVVVKPQDSTVAVFDVGDGPGETDLLLAGGIRQDGATCGMSKEGAGRMSVRGQAALSGVITVKAGHLDLAAATLDPKVRLQLADAARISVPDTRVRALWIAGEKQAAGRWGAPGSVAAGKADHEAAQFSGLGILTVEDDSPSNREMFRRMKHGFFVHYVWDNGGGATPIRKDGSRPGTIDELANEFDAPGFANDMETMGVECVFFTAWHANHFPLYPSAVTDRTAGGPRSPKRDMLGDMIDALRAKGIRVYFYTHPFQPVFQMPDWSDYVAALYGEMTDRYGDRIDGMYFDENDPDGNMRLDFRRIGRAIRLRNPDMVLVQNNYGNLYANDIPVGEWLSHRGTDPMNWGQASSHPIAHIISNWWIASQPVESKTGMCYTGEGIYRFTVLSAGSCTAGGGMLWATGPYVGGGWEHGVMEEMGKAGQLIGAVSESIRKTYPSQSYPTAHGTPIGQLKWGVATRSVDDTREYLHVLKAPEGKQLKLPPPADGKQFARARLLPSGTPVALEQSADGLTLTLGTQSEWNPINTVIAMEVTSPGERCWTNNTHPAIRYEGASWALKRTEGLGDYENDRHVATADGDRFSIPFQGTHIDVFSSLGPDQGVVEFFVDGKPFRKVDLSEGKGSRAKVLSVSGLAPGKHVLAGVKRSGRTMVVDGFQITEIINNNDPRIRYTKLTTFNDNASDEKNSLAYITYSPGHWQSQRRDWNEYQLDVTWSQVMGATFKVKFNGTGIVLKGNGIGVIDFSLNGEFLKKTDMGAGPRSHAVGVDINGLKPGWHELTGVVSGGPYVQIDSFSVYHSNDVDWKRVTAPGRGCFRDDLHLTSAAQELAMLEVSADDLDVLAPAFDVLGTGQYWINDHAVHLTNHYRDLPQGSMMTFRASDVMRLTPGKQKLRVVLHRGDRLGLDAVRVYRKAGATP